MPSLNPIRLRGVACVLVVEDVRPKPCWTQRTVAVPFGDARQVADRVVDDLGVVPARLDAEVAAGPGRIERIAGEGRQVLEGGRAVPGEPEPVRPVALEDRT